MLVYKIQQVVAAQPIVNKPWDMPAKGDQPARSGVSIYSDVTVIGQDGAVAVIRVKGKTEDVVKQKLATLTPGKPAEIRILPDEQTRGVAILNA